MAARQLDSREAAVVEACVSPRWTASAPRSFSWVAVAFRPSAMVLLCSSVARTADAAESPETFSERSVKWEASASGVGTATAESGCARRIPSTA